MNIAKRVGELDEPQYHGIVDDLVAYTGLTKEDLWPYLLRQHGKDVAAEFSRAGLKSRAELSWYYCTSSAYLFANAVHPYDPRMDMIKGGLVLDYGAGVGCNTIGLAKRGCPVDFVEIGRLQADFINFRAKRRGLMWVREIAPYHEDRFDPVGCVRRKYDAIVAIDVLEHIPTYHLTLRHLIDRLIPGGLIIETTPFDPEANDVAIHLQASMPIAEAMIGMKQIGDGVWKKA